MWYCLQDTQVKTDIGPNSCLPTTGRHIPLGHWCKRPKNWCCLIAGAKWHWMSYRLWQPDSHQIRKKLLRHSKGAACTCLLCTPFSELPTWPPLHCPHRPCSTTVDSVFQRTRRPNSTVAWTATRVQISDRTPTRKETSKRPCNVPHSLPTLWPKSLNWTRQWNLQDWECKCRDHHLHLDINMVNTRVVGSTEKWPHYWVGWRKEQADLCSQLLRGKEQSCQPSGLSGANWN